MTKFDQYTTINQNKRVLIWGLGLQGGGESAIRFFSQFTPHIRITDLKTQEQLRSTLDNLSDIKLALTLGQHKQEDFDWADIVLVNQDIFNKAPDSPYLKYVIDNNKLETQTGLFFKLCDCPIIGITGSRGKTTTTIAIAKLLENAGYKIILGGNIPNSQNLDSINQSSQSDFAVLELSNFQLHGLNFDQLSPYIAIVTSISPDHLISYKNPDQYIEDKITICKYQSTSNYLIIKKSIDVKNKFINNTKAKIIEFDKNTLPSDWQLKLPGIHNRENLGAVFSVANILNIDQSIIQRTITQFTSVKYRLETIAEHHHISFVNDTTASTPTAAQIALQSFPAGKIIWIAGGNSKNLPQQDLVNTAAQSCKKIILLQGTATDQFKKDLEIADPQFNSKYLGTFDNFQQAIQTAYQHAESEDIILLSPGFTSFGMFSNEFERGQLFNQYVQQLIS